MPNPIAGASATMMNGKATASATIRVASRRAIATSGEDKSNTGNSVQADMDQSETSCRPASGAMSAGNSKVAQNATAASRRSGVVGQAISRKAARFGRAATATMTSGIAT